MRLRHFFSVLTLGLVALQSAATAADTFKNSAEVRISERVRAMMNVAPNSVRPAPVPGLYEVVINRSRVFYVDPEVRFLIAGRIFEAATETDLTAKRMEELSRVSLNELPLKDAITVVYGKGERKIAVFTDANCSYCKVLEKSLREIGNVTVYNFIYPILNSREASRNIVCAKNPVSAFQNHMLTGADPAPAVCDDSVLERNLRLGSDLQITGTPHIIFSNGERFAGAMPIDRLREALASQ